MAYDKPFEQPLVFYLSESDSWKESTRPEKDKEDEKWESRISLNSVFRSNFTRVHSSLTNAKSFRKTRRRLGSPPATQMDVFLMALVICSSASEDISAKHLTKTPSPQRYELLNRGATDSKSLHTFSPVLTSCSCFDKGSTIGIEWQLEHLEGAKSNRREARAKSLVLYVPNVSAPLAII